MNLQQLEYFNKIAETENFTAAAQLLSVSQPALSKAISNLESELGVPLFKKEGRNIKLTPFGNMFLNHTTLALSEIEKGVQKIKNIINPNTGIISISSTYNVGTYFMPFIIADFLNNNQGVKFQFNHQSVCDMIKDLKNKKIDLFFFDSADTLNTNNDIEFIPIKKNEYVLIVPKDHKLSSESEVSLKDLKDEYFVASCGLDKDKMLSYSKCLGYVPKISIQPSNSIMFESLVAAGAGISLIPNTELINKNLVSVVKIKEQFKESIIYMGWYKNSYITPIAKSFKDYVASQSSL